MYKSSLVSDIVKVVFTIKKTGQIQAKGPQVEKDEGPSGEGQSPQVEKDEGPEAETLSRLLIVAEGPNNLKAQVKYVF